MTGPGSDDRQVLDHEQAIDRILFHRYKLDRALAFSQLQADLTRGAALVSNTIGGSNTATGVSALAGNFTGNNNTATGVAALVSNSDGSFNTATGLSALHDNTLGSFNTAVGDHALFANTVGSGNTAVGDSALSSVSAGSSNTALGQNAGRNLFKSDSNNIDIGFDVESVAGESNTIRIGNSDITTTVIRGISGQTIASGDPVLVAANGQLGTATSSRRFKNNMQPMDKPVKGSFRSNRLPFATTKRLIQQLPSSSDS